MAENDDPAVKRPRRSCTVTATEQAAVSPAEAHHQNQTRERPTGRILIVHANNKPYGEPRSGPNPELGSSLLACR